MLLASQRDSGVLGDSAFDEVFAELDRRKQGRRLRASDTPEEQRVRESVPIDVPGSSEGGCRDPQDHARAAAWWLLLTATAAAILHKIRHCKEA
jgi:hypothetical protein